jgi:protocatechuate 3,4-dioxygenase beta subunit
LNEGEIVSGVDFFLERGERVFGVVRDAQGAPIPGAKAGAWPAGKRRAMPEPEAQAEAREDGSFEISGLTSGKKEIVARADGYRRSDPVFVEVAPGAAPHVEIRLEKGVFVAGRVTGPEKKPLAGIRVTAAPRWGGGPFGGRGGADGGEATTGEDGRYRVEGLAGRNFRVTAEAPEGSGLAAATAEARANEENCDLELKAGASIEGAVVSAGTKEPIPGAGIVATLGSLKATATTRDDGTFVLAPLAGGTWSLVASGGERAPATVEIKIEAGEARSGVVIELDAGGAIEGRVVTAKDRRPLAGAIVRVVSSGGGGGARRMGGEELLVEAVAGGADFGEFVSPEQLEEMLSKNTATDSRGRFRIAKLPVGEHRVYAAHADHPGAGVMASIERPGATAEVEIALPEGGGIAGRVTDGSGAPRGDEMVVAFSFAGRARTGRTDGRGDYEIKGLAPGAYFVSLGMEMQARLGGGRGGMGSFQPGALGFTAKPANVEAGRLTRVDFGAEPLATVTGLVTRGGAPVADEFVSFFPENGGLGVRGIATSADGRYEVQLAQGKYVMRVANVSESIEVPAGVPRIERDVHLPEGAIAGRVVNAASGEPLRARVQIYKAERKGAADSLAGLLGALAGDVGSNPNDGTFRARGLAPGTYTVTARAEGFAEARQEGIEVAPEATTEGVELALEPGGVFRGRVTDERGEPVPNAAIWAVDVDAKDLPSGDPPRAGDDGRFEVRRFAPGRYRLTVLSEQFAPWRQFVEFAGGVAEFAPVMLEGGTLELAVLDASGRPIPGAMVELRYPDGERVIGGFLDFVEPRQPTGPDGKLRRPRLPPGPLQGKVTVPSLVPGVAAREASFEAIIIDKAETQLAVRVP